MACERRSDATPADGATKECATCRGAAAKCWRCAPSTRPPGRHSLSGSGSSEGGRVRAVAPARTRHPSHGSGSSNNKGGKDVSSSSSVGSSSAGSSVDVVAHGRHRHRTRRRRDRSRRDTGNAQSDSTLSSNPTEEDGDRSRCVLERYVPDKGARARTVDTMSTEAASVCLWYNRRAIEARQGIDATPTLSQRAPSATTTSSSSVASGATDSLSCATASGSSMPPDGDPSRDARGAINFCKSVLIGRYVQPHCTIMDLGCGRGQDVAKLAHARPRCVFFVDVADEPLAEAERRWRRTRFAFPAAFVQDDFCARDGLLAHRQVVVYRDDPQRLHGQRHRAVPDQECGINCGDGVGIVDAITCQFAVQHAFATRESARAFVANVRRALRPSGVFLGIVADAARLWDLKKARRAEIDTDTATPAAAEGEGKEAECRPRRAMFDAAGIDDAHEAGARSHVPCTLTVGSDGEPCPQYTVLFSDLNAMCVEAGLVLMASDDLAAFFDIESINPRNASMLERMKAPLRLDDPDDREHLALYRVFAFARPDRATTRPTPALASERVTADARHGTQQHRERPPCRVISYTWSSDVAADRSQ
ncbi:mRNA guanine-n(7)-methyltransferase [Pandoravirus kuranda]|uniref:mRNA (guanine-N(7))-methyltransferase n=1 Tax=Pandoravirus kuranda TaxID=3019033 RepID=A0AA95J458_9VIRU|nr:mRNA guanine-n(7)-methyltransferase [Pandoravirus kuranda]